jgi:putative addiction module CopG family antidote
MSLYPRYFEPGPLRFPCEGPRLRALIAVATCSQKVDVYHVRRADFVSNGEKYDHESVARRLCLPYSKTMQVDLTPDQKAFARRAIETGRLHSEEDAVREALALWEERERQRAEFLLTLDDARASLARGEGRAITQESMRQLASEVKERGRARLLAELTTTT